MAVAALPLFAQLGWPPAVAGLVQSSFLWGYTAVQLRSGVLADALGGRAVVAFGVALFALASAATPLAFAPPVVAAGLALPAALAVRAAVGLGAGVVLPSVSSLLARHVPATRRSAAVGASFAGFHAGTALGLAAAPALMAAASGWPALFYTAAAAAAPVLALWLLAVPPQPAAAGATTGALAPAVAATAAAAASAAPPPPTVAQLLASGPVRAIVAANAVNHWNYFTFLFLMPLYFASAWGLDVRASALFSLAPWLAMGAASSLAGAAADALLPALGATRVRKVAQSVGFLGPAACLGLLLCASSPLAALACLTAALGLAACGQAGFVANIGDVAPRSAGRLFGLANTVGCLAGIAGTAAAGVVVQAAGGSWRPLITLQAALYLAGWAAYVAQASGEPQFDS